MQKYTLRENATIKDALVALNDIAHEMLTLFVINEKNQMVGTLTDGDIRRGLIYGSQLSDEVSSVMHREFKYIKGIPLGNNNQWLI